MQKIHTYSLSNIKQILGHLKAKSLALKVGACKRKHRKFSVVDLLLSYWQLLSLGEFSYDNWASQISSLIGQPVSGQAICKRMNPSMVLFLKELLRRSFKKKCDSLFESDVFNYFSNVYIQDATHFSLPGSLSAFFPGSYSKYGDAATAKVQAIFNIKKGFFSDFQLHSFRDNDQKDALRIVDQISTNDLVIRDLGYFTLESFLMIQNKGAYFLSRYKYGVNVFDIVTGKQLNLLKFVKKNGCIDKWVELGNTKKVTCRLIAIPLPEKIAGERRRKARTCRNKKTNHSKEYLDLLGYSIYITNVAEDQWNAKQVNKAYRSRWYIEILFKAWKSNLKMSLNIPPRYINQQRAEFFFYASLLMVNLVVMPIFNHSTKVARDANQCISILKICSFIRQQLHTILKIKRLDRLLEQLVYHCVYENRKSRYNSIEQMVLIDS